MTIVAIKSAIVSFFNKNKPSEASSPLMSSTTDNYGALSDRDPEAQPSTPTKTQTFSSDNDNGLPFGWLLGKTDPRVMSDLIIGLSDGLTVPFALTAGLSSLGDSKLVITGGMAELVSGAISMGLGGYLAARSESEYYKSQVRKEKQEFFENPECLAEEVSDVMIDMGASEETTKSFVRDLEADPKAMIDFVIKFGRGLDEPPDGRQLVSALTIGSGYFFGGFIPLIPYFFTDIVRTGLIISVVVMIFTLFWFGYFKTIVSMGDDTSHWVRVSEGFQMVAIGSFAAGCAWGLVFLIDS
ncbi:hypothetical protein OGAPHI_000716 [Ogataea philodendri]|uniref:Protein CCC1 n=1 Tax=Ogataea philodendri TaxID=1378263 RepID=A0A9P8PGA2_9ASCO|nr:uncharacterized protein OGAPHI_000716 [Ogataea philodendri]KAH3671005.1 hypothetical protein OGAPHI_000716 [Ogataea philodendri]